MRLFLISLFVLGVMAACGGSGTSSPELTDTPASDAAEASPQGGTDATPETDTEEGPQIDVGRPAFRLEFNEITGIADWDEVEGAETYELEGEVIWWPDCKDWDAGFTEPQRVPIAETLSAGTASFPLPKPDDARYTRLREFFLLINAIDASDSIIGSNNTGQKNEPTCGMYVP